MEGQRLEEEGVCVDTSEAEVPSEAALRQTPRYQVPPLRAARCRARLYARFRAQLWVETEFDPDNFTAKAAPRTVLAAVRTLGSVG